MFKSCCNYSRFPTVSKTDVPNVPKLLHIFPENTENRFSSCVMKSTFSCLNHNLTAANALQCPKLMRVCPENAKNRFSAFEQNVKVFLFKMWCRFMCCAFMEVSSPTAHSSLHTEYLLLLFGGGWFQIVLVVNKKTTSNGLGFLAGTGLAVGDASSLCPCWKWLGRTYRKLKN